MLDGPDLTFMGDVHCDQYAWTADPTVDKTAKRMRADVWVASPGLLFPTRERLEVGEPVLTAGDVQMMLVHYLPRRNRTLEDVVDLLRQRFKRRGEDFPEGPA